MILKLYTVFHVVISLLGILAGFIVMAGMISASPLHGWTEVFLDHDSRDERHRILLSDRTPDACARASA